MDVETELEFQWETARVGARREKGMPRTACMRLTSLAAAHATGLSSDMDQDNLALPQLLETVSPNSWEPSTHLHLDCPHIKPVPFVKPQPSAEGLFLFQFPSGLPVMRSGLPKVSRNLCRISELEQGSTCRHSPHSFLPTSIISAEDQGPSKPTGWPASVSCRRVKLENCGSGSRERWSLSSAALPSTATKEPHLAFYR